MADEISAIEGCIASAGLLPRGDPQRYDRVNLSDATEIIKEVLSVLLREHLLESLSNLLYSLLVT
jgi:hypothetical protein